MSIVTYENVDTPVFELDTMRYLFRDGLQGMWIDFLPDYAFADTGLTTPANPGEGIAGYVDRSGNGLNGTQPVITARPILGRVPRTGRRNLLTYTEDLNNEAWVKSAGMGGEGVLPGIPDPRGGTSAFRIVPPEGTDVIPYFYYGTMLPALTALHTSFYVKDAGYRYIALRVRVADATALWVLDLEEGAVAQIGSSTIASDVTLISEGGGWWKANVQRTTPTANNYRFFAIMPLPDDWQSIQAPFRANGIYSPDGVSGIDICFPQVTEGNEDTPYQRVGNEYDVTEAGVPSVYYAHYDGADDVLPSSLTIPSISEGCFILVGTAGIWIDNEWVNTTGTLTVGPTTYTGGPSGILPVVGNILSIIWREEPLTEAEKAEVVRYGVKRGSPGEIE